MLSRYPGVLVVVVMTIQAGCTAVSVSPPLAPSRAAVTPAGPGEVLLTSGAFAASHEAIGVMQLTQAGYRWFYEVELIDDANPTSILFKVADYAREHGAQGIQFLELIDLKPQSPGEKVAKQVQGVIRIADAAKRGQALSQAAREGEETRWLVRGEFVVFTRSQG